MQENVSNITFANDGKVEFENASIEINNVELLGDIDSGYVADEDNDPLEMKAVYLKTFKVELDLKNWYKWYLNADHHKTDKYAVK